MEDDSDADPTASNPQGSLQVPDIDVVPNSNTHSKCE